VTFNCGPSEIELDTLRMETGAKQVLYSHSHVSVKTRRLGCHVENKMSSVVMTMRDVSV
jgi:hypothetical protein